MRIEGEEVWLEHEQDKLLPIEIAPETPIPLTSFTSFLEGWLETAVEDYRRCMQSDLRNERSMAQYKLSVARLGVLLNTQSLLGFSQQCRAEGTAVGAEAEAWLSGQTIEEFPQNPGSEGA